MAKNVKTRDIVRDLRLNADEIEYSAEPGSYGEKMSKLLHAAADEIESLRARVSDMGWTISPDQMGR